MSAMWKTWEGRTVDGKFPLQAYLGGSDHSAVFLTIMPSAIAGKTEKAAIKLITFDKAEAQKQLVRWQTIRELSHPSLIHLFESGSCELDGTALLYIVEEYAEENLGQIIPERALTAEEAQGMLTPVLEALQCLHDKGFVHGSIRPSNILAVGNQVKVSSDGLHMPDENGSARVATAYDPLEAARGLISKSADVWQLGMTLVEVLTQRLPVWDRSSSGGPVVPATIAEPFRDVANHCLQVDEGKRWSIAEIQARLRADQSNPAPMLVKNESVASTSLVSGQQRPSRAWSYLLGLAVVAAVAFLLIPRSKPPAPVVAVQSTQSEEARTTVRPEAKPGPAVTGAVAEDKNAAADKIGVVHRVMPEVSPGARRTIHGTIKVRVIVNVDASGNVTKAKVESGRVSKYFTRIALDTAQGWKFAPAMAGDQSGDREWRLQFGFSRARTDATATKITR